MSEAMGAWMTARFAAPAPERAAPFITTLVDVSGEVAGLTPAELRWLMLYVIVDERRYSGVRLTRAESMFVAQCKNCLKEVINVMKFDTQELDLLWRTSGIAQTI